MPIFYLDISQQEIIEESKKDLLIQAIVSELSRNGSFNDTSIRKFQSIQKELSITKDGILLKLNKKWLLRVWRIEH